MEIPAFRNELREFERSGAIKDVYQSLDGEFIVKKFVDTSKDEKRTVKLADFSYQITPYSWSENEPDISSPEFARNRKADYEQLRKYLGNLVLETGYLVAEDEKGQSATFEIQEKIEGKTLGQLKSEEVKKVKNQLGLFAQRSLEMFNSIGWLPDVHEDLGKTDNIIVEASLKIDFIDNDAIYKLPDDLFGKYQDNLYSGQGINPDLLTELEERGYSSRYASNINQTFLSILNHSQIN
jgi:hypothetical protein